MRRWLAGISFAPSLSFDTLAFSDEAIMVQVRLGVLIASILSGVAAAIVLVLVDRSKAVVPSAAAE